jgi:hypothetical protein
MDVTKKIESLTKEQRKILKMRRRANLYLSDYKASLRSQLIDNPPLDEEKKFWIENMLMVIDEEEKNPSRDYGYLVPIFIFIVLPLIFLIAFKTGLLERTVNPQKYWRVKVATLEEKVNNLESFINGWNSYKPGIDSKYPVNYDELVRKLIIEGKKPDEAKRIASETIKKLDDASRNIDRQMSAATPKAMKTANERLDNLKRELQHAKDELSKYQ